MCGSTSVPGEADLSRDGIPRAFDAAASMRSTYLFVRGARGRSRISRRSFLPGVPKLLAFGELNVEPTPLPAEAWQPERRTWVREHLAAADKNVAAAEGVAEAISRPLRLKMRRQRRLLKPNAASRSRRSSRPCWNAAV